MYTCIYLGFFNTHHLPIARITTDIHPFIFLDVIDLYCEQVRYFEIAHQAGKRILQHLNCAISEAVAGDKGIPLYSP